MRVSSVTLSALSRGTLRSQRTSTLFPLSSSSLRSLILFLTEEPDADDDDVVETGTTTSIDLPVAVEKIELNIYRLKDAQYV
jgi:hypothetical protein